MSSQSASASDGVNLDELEKGWTNPFAQGTPLHDLYEKRISQGRDLVIIVDDYNAGRGTGKTIAALQLAFGMDQTDAGVTKEKVTIDPEEIREAYTQQPKRSALVLDEGEVNASNRQSMTKVNQALREIMSMGRVEQKYVIITTPLKEFIDKDLRKLADVWISMTKRGTGLVHYFDWQSYAEKLLTPKKQWIEFEDIDTDHEMRNVYNYLTREKRKRMRGSDGGGFIPLEEHREELRKAEKEAKSEARDEIIVNLAQHPEVELSQSKIGDVCLGMSQSHVSNLVSD